MEPIGIYQSLRLFPMPGRGRYLPVERGEGLSKKYIDNGKHKGHFFVDSKICPASILSMETWAWFSTLLSCPHQLLFPIFSLGIFPYRHQGLGIK